MSILPSNHFTFAGFEHSVHSFGSDFSFFCSLKMIKVGVQQSGIMGGAQWCGVLQITAHKALIYIPVSAVTPLPLPPQGLSEGTDRFVFLSGLDSPHFWLRNMKQQLGSPLVS